MKKTLKLGLSLMFKSFCVYYISNIFIYFTFLRQKLIEGVEILYESSGSREVFNAKNISKGELLNMTLCDTEIFNPFYNIGYSFGNYFLLIPSAILVILFLLIVKFKKNYDH